MKLSVPYNDDIEWMNRILADFDVTEFYGEDGTYESDREPIGYGNRRENLETFIKACHAKGVEFNYLINDVIADQYLRDETRFNVELDRLKAIGVDWVTVTVPYLGEAAFKHDLRVSTSYLLPIDTPPTVEYLTGLGFSRIWFSPLGTRCIPVVRSIRKGSPSTILGISTSSRCRLGCPNIIYCHTRNLGREWFSNFCWPFPSLEAFLQLDWIRAKDVPRYEEVGISMFHVSDRAKSGNLIYTDVKATIEKQPVDILQNLNGVTEADFDPFFEFLFTKGCSRLCGKCGFCSTFASQLESKIHG